MLRSYTFPLAPWVPLPQLPKPRTPAVRATLGLSVLSGLTMGGFPPLETLSQDQKRLVAVFAGRGDDGALIPYATSFYFCAASLLCAWPACVALARRPVYGARPRVPSIVGLCGAAACAARAAVAGRRAVDARHDAQLRGGQGLQPQAVAYAIGQSAPPSPRCGASSTGRAARRAACLAPRPDVPLLLWRRRGPGVVQ